MIGTAGKSLTSSQPGDQERYLKLIVERFVPWVIFRNSSNGFSQFLWRQANKSLSKILVHEVKNDTGEVLHSLVAHRVAVLTRGLLTFHNTHIEKTIYAEGVGGLRCYLGLVQGGIQRCEFSWLLVWKSGCNIIFLAPVLLLA